jgi:hypothetical protein
VPAEKEFNNNNNNNNNKNGFISHISIADTLNYNVFTI